MTSLAHLQGKIDAAAAFGLEKIAIDWAGVGNTAKEWMIGQPQQFHRELQQGKLFQPGGLIHQQLFPKTFTGKLFSYGLPALGVASAFAAPREQRGSALGSAVGGAIGGTLGMPLGLVGSAVGAGLVGRLGQSVGGIFDSPRLRSERVVS